MQIEVHTLPGIYHLEGHKSLKQLLGLIRSALTRLNGFSGQSLNRGSSQDEDAIRQLFQDFIKAWNDHDAKAFSMVFSEDSDFTNVAGSGAHGRANIERFHAPLFATRFRDSHQSIVDLKIRFIRSDVATVDAIWEMTGARNADGQEITLRKGLLNFTIIKESNRWCIAVMHNMNLSSAPQ